MNYESKTNHSNRRAEEHKAALLKDIHLLEEQSRVSAKMSDIERRIKQTNEELERMKEWQASDGPGCGYTPVVLQHKRYDPDIDF